MQSLVTRDTGHPNNKIVDSISRCDPGRAATALTLAPGEHDRRRICCSNFVGPDGTGVVVKANVRSLACVISHSRRSSVDPAHIRLVRRARDATEIVAIK